MPDPITPVDPTRTALLVMDLQPSILGRLDDPAPLLDRAAEAIRVARSAGAHVGFVRVGLTDEEFDAVPPTSQFAPMAASARDAMHADAPGTAVHERVAPEEGDIVVRKRRVGALSTTDLDAQLAERGVRHLVLCGVSTSGVVLSTVRDAKDRDYDLAVLRDVCVDPDPVVHEVLVERVLPAQATMLDLDDLAAHLGA